ncbi:hypothetical protein ONZ51_g4742 [Trametes cubensis]|uniref:Uncharacterized protein n=1 Tax=Trametes cubensis TaxID=1111947 RepID=A0AAD7TXN5_9APHY|nr:hypothetical protein ONZ51_g4742 [Trametes cubensis]
MPKKTVTRKFMVRKTEQERRREMLARQKRVSTKALAERRKTMRESTEEGRRQIVVDTWLAEHRPHEIKDKVDAPLSPGQARCVVFLQCIPYPDPDEYWWDPDTYVLRLTIVEGSRDPEGKYVESERRVVLGDYTGHPGTLDAPDWARLPAGRTMVFRDSTAEVLDFLRRIGKSPGQVHPAVGAQHALPGPQATGVSSTSGQP